MKFVNKSNLGKAVNERRQQKAAEERAKKAASAKKGETKNGRH